MLKLFSKKLFSTSAILTTAIALSACQSMPNFLKVGDTIESPTLRAQLKATKAGQNHIGDMYLRSIKDGVLVYGTLAGLKPNSTVAVHIHENGSCSNKGKDAGGHFNPMNKPHGYPDSMQSHAGDMPNVTANEHGVATYTYLNKKIVLDKASTNSVYQRAIVVHEGADDYTSQPSGDAGDRIACGVINTI